MSSPPRPGLLLGAGEENIVVLSENQSTPEKTLTPEFIKQNYGQLRNLLAEHEKKEKLKGTMGTTSIPEEGFYSYGKEPSTYSQVRQNNSGKNTGRPVQRRIGGDTLSPIRKMINLPTQRKRNEGITYPGQGSQTNNGDRGTLAEEDLTEPYQRRALSRFTQRIARAPCPERLCMPTHVKTYYGSGDPDDHLSLFCAAAENHHDWTMPVWCHMFEQTLVGPARLWFNSLPGASVDSFDDLQDMFEAHFMHQQRYERDPVEIHNIRQSEHEPIMDFLKRFNQESMEIKGATEGMRVSGYLHAIRNKQLVEQLSRVVPKTMQETEQRTRDFVRGKEAAALSEDRFRKEGKNNPPWKKDIPFRGHVEQQPPRPMFAGREEPGKEEKGRDTRRGDERVRSSYQPYERKMVFTALLKTPCEILATEAVARKFIPPTTGKNLAGPTDKYCEYHQGTGHHTNDCFQLKKRIEKAVQSGELTHLVKDIRGGPAEGERKPKIN